MEIWKDILGYEGVYQVSNLGRVKSIARYTCKGVLVHLKDEIILKACIRGGYNRVRLYSNTVSYMHSVHKLVAETFIPNTENKIQVNHINGIKADNKLENLEWVTNRENQIKYHILKDVCTSKYTGVSLIKKNNKWRADILHNKKRVRIGEYDTEYKAHLAYQDKLVEISNPVWEYSNGY